MRVMFKRLVSHSCAVHTLVGMVWIGFSIAAWAQPAQPAQPAASATPIPRQRISQDLWMMHAQGSVPKDGVPDLKPVITREALDKLRSTACVVEVSMRKSDLPIALRGKDGKSMDLTLTFFDNSGMGARGWRIAGQPKRGSYYVSPDIAAALGLGVNASAGQTIELVSRFVAETDTSGKPLNRNIELKINTPQGEVSSLKVPYGGMIEADLNVVDRQPREFVVMFEPLIRSKSAAWTSDQLRSQLLETRVYLRTKAGLKGTELQACRTQLAAHMHSWAKELGHGKWELLEI